MEAVPAYLTSLSTVNAVYFEPPKAP